MPTEAFEELKGLLAKPFLWPEELRRVYRLANGCGVDVHTEKRLASDWPVSEQVAGRCWTMGGYDRSQVALQQARAGERCVICGKPKPAGCATCGAESCLTWWLLPAKARAQEEALANHDD